MEQERNLKEKMMLSFRGIVEALFKGKGIIMMGEHLLAKEYLRFIERVHQVYSKLTKDDMLIVLLMRMRFRNTEIARLLHVKPASFRLRRWRLKKKLEGLGSDLRSIIMKL